MEVPPVVRVESSSSEIPLGIKLVALWEFIKAAGIVVIFGGMRLFHGSTAAPSLTGQVAVSKEGMLFIVGVVALYPAVLGFGLWNLQRWARWFILPAFALSAPASWFPWHADQAHVAYLSAFMPSSLASVVATLDVLSVLVLLMPDSRKAFGDSDPGMEEGSSLLDDGEQNESEGGRFS